jgi:hypothetical protein
MKDTQTPSVPLCPICGMPMIVAPSPIPKGLEAARVGQLDGLFGAIQDAYRPVDGEGGP